jgi:hypothetical protein
MSILLPYDLFSYHPEFILRNTVVDCALAESKLLVEAIFR